MRQKPSFCIKAFTHKKTGTRPVFFIRLTSELHAFPNGRNTLTQTNTHSAHTILTIVLF